MTILVQLLWQAIVYSWVLLPVIFLSGLYALLAKPRWRHYGICALELSINLLIILGLMFAFTQAGRGDIAYKWGGWYFITGFLLHVAFLAGYGQRLGWPTWQMAMMTILGGILHPVLFMALSMTFCGWLSNSCL